MNDDQNPVAPTGDMGGGMPTPPTQAPDDSGMGGGTPAPEVPATEPEANNGGTPPAAGM